MLKALLGSWALLSFGRPHMHLLYEFSVTRIKYFVRYAFMCRLLITCLPAHQHSSVV